ncbi:MAG: hypothetical protein ACYCU7_18575 [Acidimicrobiales bacterium]
MEVVRLLRQYRPENIEGEEWDSIAPLVLTLVLLAQPGKREPTRRFLSVVARYVLWARDQGVELSPWSLADLALIERFVQTGCDEIAPGSRSTYRAVLTRVATAAGEAIPQRGSRTPIPGRNPLRPYSTAEIAALSSLADGQPTELQRHRLRASLGLGLGAGIVAGELARVKGSDVRVDRWGVHVHVAGEAPREVTVVEQWEAHVAIAAAAAVDGLVMRPGHAQANKNVVADMVNHLAAQRSGPRLSIPRLRATWICEHLQRGTPLGVLVPAAGYRSVHALSRYLPYVERVPEARARQWMRGVVLP